MSPARSPQQQYEHHHYNHYHLAIVDRIVSTIAKLSRQLRIKAKGIIAIVIISFIMVMMTIIILTLINIMPGIFVVEYESCIHSEAA